MQRRNKNPPKHQGRILFLKIINSLRALYTLFIYIYTFLLHFLVYLETQCVSCSAFFLKTEICSFQN